MKNPCKIDARKRHAKSMENDAKREPKWEPKSIQNKENIEKKSMQNFILKFDAKKDAEMKDKGTKGEAPGGKEGKPPKAALRYLANSI